MRRIFFLCLCVLARAGCHVDYEDDVQNDTISTTAAPSPKIKRDYSFDTIVQLPEIIINRANPQPTGGYHYPVPDFPAQFDEPTSPRDPFIYGPPARPTNPPPLLDVITQIPPTFIPIAYPPLGTPPGLDLQPPQYDPIPTDDTVVIPLPPAADPYLPPAPTTAGGFVQARVPTNPVQMKVFNMSCMDGANFRYFRATMRTSHFLENAPVVEDSPGDCVFGNGDTFRIDLDGNKMTKCGVKYCNNNNQVNLCMSLRIPSVRFLRLPEDALITLQCKVQDKIVSHTKHLRISPQFVQARSTPTIATGGSQRNFESQVVLYRKAPGRADFSQAVTPGSVVQLGEDLLLRASVKDGDGWKFSRMGAVIIHRIGEKRLAKESVILVDNVGCRAATMRSVCPDHPRQQSPLVTVLPIRAFMFQGANSGDEMVLSVRMLGCVLAEDCNQPRTCEEKASTLVATGRTRARRALTPRNSTDSWQSFVEFRVAAPANFGKPAADAPAGTPGIAGITSHSTATTRTYRYAFAGLGILGLMICFVALIFVKRARRYSPS